MRRLRMMVVAAAAMAALGLCAPAASATHPSPAHRDRIVFSRTVGGETPFTEIVSIRPDGSDPIRVVTGVSRPRWAPRGYRLLVTYRDENFITRPAVVRGRGGRLKKLGDPSSTVRLTCTAWSPNGRTLACGGEPDWDKGPQGLYTVRSSDGRDLRLLSPAFDSPDLPGDYSPDGTRIVFLRRELQRVRAALYIVNADGTGLRQLTDWEDVWASPGSWSPNGRWILFSNIDGLHLVRPDGSGLNPLRLRHAPQLTLVDQPRWSPDGRRIVFVGYVSPSRRDLYVMRANGTGITRIPGTVSAGSPDWGVR